MIAEKQLMKLQNGSDVRGIGSSDLLPIYHALCIAAEQEFFGTD